MIPEAAVEAAWDKLHENPVRPIGIDYAELAAALEAAAPHMGSNDEDKLAAIIVLLDPFERVAGWMATDDEAGRYAVEAINKIRAILDTP